MRRWVYVSEGKEGNVDDAIYLTVGDGRQHATGAPYKFGSTRKIRENIKLYPLAPVACSTHKKEKMAYLEWFRYADAKTKAGETQKQCKKCGRWYFKNEFEEKGGKNG
jgi:hypothetical protein